MKYDEEKEIYILSTGKTSYVDNSMHPELLVDIFIPLNDAVSFTPEERKEIAEYMIELWREWGSATESTVYRKEWAK